ncbi:chemotaxis protein CheX [Herbivorax sp. ANBcel31]|uniref:chemotaxis protein CheX n=1 Tax=Herbivorax sp. ANBcel31 TaxID=3069754 RepID=UPI0027B2118A|nr:chemotaxis protein CheX [Herbivorax sp. ANBcel31]MDQ2084918.1 chemotaxis protein CheX [Herbivorax sp. ANBcel31]
MKEEYIDIISEAGKSLLESITGFDIQVKKAYKRDNPYYSDNVAIMITLLGSIRGHAVLTLNGEFACKIASAMMCGLEVNELDDMGKSALAELGNMVMGNCGTQLSQKGLFIDIGPPSVLIGEKMEISFDKMAIITIPFIFNENEKEKVELNISYSEE